MMPDNFDTPIPQGRQGEYADWLKQQSAAQKRDVSRDSEDYDVQGFFLSGGGADQRGHGTDVFKKPNHPTFSNESKYSGRGATGGRWVNQGGKDYFYASPDNLKYRSADDLKQYFAEREPDVTLVLPGTPVGAEQTGLPGIPSAAASAMRSMQQPPTQRKPRSIMGPGR